MSLRDKILAAEDIPTESVEIPEWGVEILMKGMSAGERIRLMEEAYNADTGQVNMSVVYPDVAIACAHDPETGDPIFTADDKEAILKKSSAAVEKLAGVGLSLSGIGKDPQDAAGKSSSEILSEDSSSS